jgi:predicted CoA-binding protein
MQRRPTVAVLGASRDRAKYGNMSVRAHLEAGYDVYPVNLHAREIEGRPAYPDLASVPVARLDRISIYLPPDVTRRMLPEIAAKGAEEVWFNPGSADPALLAEAAALGLNAIFACSIVGVGQSPADFGGE